MLEEKAKETRTEVPETEEEEIVTLDLPKVDRGKKEAAPSGVVKEAELGEASVSDDGSEEVAPSDRNWDRGIKALTWKERFRGISQSRFALVLLSVTLSAILMGADYGSRSFGYMSVHALLVVTLGRCLFLLYKDATGRSFVDDIRQRLTGGRERSW